VTVHAVISEFIKLPYCVSRRQRSATTCYWQCLWLVRQKRWILDLGSVLSLTRDAPATLTVHNFNVTLIACHADIFGNIVISVIVTTWYYLCGIYCNRMLSYFTLWPIKDFLKVHGILYITLSYIDQYSKFSSWHTVQAICNKAIIKFPAEPQICQYTTLWNITL